MARDTHKEQLQQLHAAVQAVQKQLDAMVDRLASLESELAGPQPPAPVQPRESHPPDRSQLGPASLLLEPPPGPSTTRRQRSIFTPPRPRIRRSAKLKQLLDDVHLLPPQSQDTLEVRLVSWWTTRVGVLLAVIAAVFFAVYVSESMAPWMRFLELLAVSLGLTVLGLWLGRQFERFGAVLFGGGLALIYFSAYAGYAVQSVRVMTDPTLAAAAQFAAVALIVASAWWRRSELIASMATSLGYVACFFSFTAQLEDCALIAAGALGAAAVYFYLGRRWRRPFLLCVPLTYVLYGIIAAGSWSRGPNIPTMSVCLAYLLAYMVVYAAADYVAVLRKTVMPAIQRRAVQICNSTGAVALGWAVTRQFYPAELDAFYFLFGGVLVALCLAYYLIDQRDALMQVYFSKGTALVTLGLITALGGRTRWIALTVQCFVLLASARRSRLIITEFAMVGVWFLSFGYFLGDAFSRGLFANPPGVLTLGAACAMGYVLLSALLFGWQAHWLSPGPEAGAEPDGVAPGRRTRFLPYLGAICVGIAACVSARAFVGPPHLAAGLALLAVAVAAVALLARHRIPLLAAVLPLVVGHCTLWTTPAAQASPSQLWLNATVLIAITMAAAWMMFIASAHHDFKPRWEEALHLLWMLSLQAASYKTLTVQGYMIAGVATSVILALATLRTWAPNFADLSWIPMALTLAGLIHAWRSTGDALPDGTSTILPWLAAAGAFAYACGYAALATLRQRLRVIRTADAYQWIHVILVVGVCGYTLVSELTNPRLMAACAAAALIIASAAKWATLKPAVYAGMVFLALSQREAYRLIFEYDLQHTAPLRMFIEVAAATLLLAVLMRRWRPDLAAAARSGWQWLLGASSMALLFTVFGRQGGALQAYTTVLWGLSAIVVLLLGVIFGVRPLRMLGLMGMGLCLPRMFVIDIRSAFHRIAAFGVLAGVLIVVGYLYHRYRHVIEGRT